MKTWIFYKIYKVGKRYFTLFIALPGEEHKVYRSIGLSIKNGRISINLYYVLFKLSPIVITDGE
jgi:hypothetical protein